MTAQDIPLGQLNPDEMGICEKCQSLAVSPLPGQGPTLYCYDYLSLRKAVDSRCYICSRVWDTLTEEQKGVASGPGFMGITYRLWRSSRSMDDEEGPILATLGFENGDDLYDCEDYNEVGGRHLNSDCGVFAFLNPSGKRTLPIKSFRLLAIALSTKRVVYGCVVDDGKQCSLSTMPQN